MRRPDPVPEGNISPVVRDPWANREREWVESLGVDIYPASEIDTRHMKRLGKLVMTWVPFEEWASKHTNAWVTHELREDARGIVWAERVIPKGRRVPKGAPVIVGPFRSAQDASRYIMSAGRLRGLHLYGAPVDVGGWEPAPYKPLTGDQLPPA